MITFFNRRELCVTFRPEDYFRIKDILHANGIPHYTKFGNSAAASGARRSTITSGTNQSVEYRIFVHKKDYEAAARLIHR